MAKALRYKCVGGVKKAIGVWNVKNKPKGTPGEWPGTRPCRSSEEFYMVRKLVWEDWGLIESKEINEAFRLGW